MSDYESEETSCENCGRVWPNDHPKRPIDYRIHGSYLVYTCRKCFVEEVINTGHVPISGNYYYLTGDSYVLIFLDHNNEIVQVPVTLSEIFDGPLTDAVFQKYKSVSLGMRDRVNASANDNKDDMLNIKKDLMINLQTGLFKNQTYEQRTAKYSHHSLFDFKSDMTVHQRLLRAYTCLFIRFNLNEVGQDGDCIWMKLSDACQKFEQVSEDFGDDDSNNSDDNDNNDNDNTYARNILPCKQTAVIEYRFRLEECMSDLGVEIFGQDLVSIITQYLWSDPVSYSRHFRDSFELEIKARRQERIVKQLHAELETHKARLQKIIESVHFDFRNDRAYRIQSRINKILANASASANAGANADENVLTNPNKRKQISDDDGLARKRSKTQSS
jgi:hypothetical protein